MNSISKDIQLPSNRKFGLFFTTVFATVGVYFWFIEYTTLSYILFVISASLLIIAFINAELLLSANKLWMKMGLLLGMIINPIVLGIIFFGMFLPVNLVCRIFRRDELRLKFFTLASYWKTRNHDNQHLEKFKNQF